MKIVDDSVTIRGLSTRESARPIDVPSPRSVIRDTLLEREIARRVTTLR